MKATIMIFVASALLVPVQPVSGQDPVKLSPNMYTVLLENEHVRVLEFRAKPGEKEPMHSHPAMLVYSFTGGKARVTTPDGKSEERETNAETAVWAEPVTHAYEHLGPGDARVLLIEMKGLTASKEPAKEGTNSSTPWSYWAPTLALVSALPLLRLAQPRPKTAMHLPTRADHSRPSRGHVGPLCR